MRPSQDITETLLPFGTEVAMLGDVAGTRYGTEQNMEDGLIKSGRDGRTVSRAERNQLMDPTVLLNQPVR